MSHLSQGVPLRDHGNYFLATLTLSTIFLSVELLPTNQTPSFVLPSLSMCSVSQLKNISFHEWILYSSIFEKINLSIVSFCRHRVDEDLKSEDVKIDMMQ